MLRTSTLLRTLLFLIPVPLAIGVIASCSDDDSTAPPISNQSLDEIDALHHFADNLAEGGKLIPAMPIYLPAGLTLPTCLEECGTAATLDGVVIEFSGGRPDPQATEAVADGMDFAQYREPAYIDQNDPEVDLDGTRATVQIGQQSQDTTFYVLTFRVGDRNFLVSVSWLTPDGTLTEEMKQQTERLAKSIIYDARDRGLVTES
jgi:hypothetical protein